MVMTSSLSRSHSVCCAVPVTREEWTLLDDLEPESQPHDLVVDLLKQLLLGWVTRRGLNAQVARNLAVRWDEAHPTIGVELDLCVIAPKTPEGDELSSLCLWMDGHRAPVLAMDVVSVSSARKGDVSAPERYAASGTEELWIFDPKLAGPRSHGGPFRIQLWRRGPDGEFARVYAGEGPVLSPAVGGWLTAVDEGRRLRIADDEALTAWWMTQEEAERAAKEAALAKIAELEEQLRAARRG